VRRSEQRRTRRGRRKGKQLPWLLATTLHNVNVALYPVLAWSGDIGQPVSVARD
jgi:hypothetical protein